MLNITTIVFASQVLARPCVKILGYQEMQFVSHVFTENIINQQTHSPRFRTCHVTLLPNVESCVTEGATRHKFTK